MGQQTGRGDQRVTWSARRIWGESHLRQSLVFLNVRAMQQPEAYIGGAAHLFDAEGKLTNDSTRGFLRKFVQAFAAWIEANRKR